MIEDVCSSNAREVALDQIEGAARMGNRERVAYWVDRLVERRMREQADGRILALPPRRRARTRRPGP